MVLRRALFALLVIASCTGPTEIFVDITTNACASNLSTSNIFVDGQQVAQAQRPKACDSAAANATVDVGTITLLPGKSIDGHVDIAVVTSVGGTCDKPDTTELECVVARRSLSFIPHTRLDLPIFVDSACAGLQCRADETCKVDATGAHCVPSTCGDDAPCSIDAGGFDVGVGDGVAFDVVPPPTCPSILPPLGAPTFSWSFETKTTDGPHEDNDLIAPVPGFTSAAIISDAPTFCGEYLRSKSSQALIASSSKAIDYFQATSFTVGFAFRPSSDPVSLLSLSASSQFGGWEIAFSNGAMRVSMFDPGITNPVYVGKTLIQPNGIWYRFAMQVKTTGTGTSVTVYEGGSAAGTTVNIAPYTVAGPAAFDVGAADVDNVTYYAQ